MSSRNRDSKKQKLVTSFITTGSVEKMLKSFDKMEKSRFFAEHELDIYCSSIAQKLYTQGTNPEKTIFFAERSLKSMVSESAKLSNPKFLCKGGENNDFNYFLIDVNESINVSDNCHYALDLMLPTCLIMLASVCAKLKRFNESLSYFSWAQRNLGMLLEKDCRHGCFLKQLEKAHIGHFVTMESMGRAEEAITHLKKVLECKEKRLEEGCLELEHVYKCLYEAYYGVDDLKEALPYCLKALEIHRKHLGGESVEVAEILKGLGGIYGRLGEYDKSLEQNRLAKSILVKVEPDSFSFVEVGLVDGYSLMELGRHKEAIEVFKSVLSHTGAREIDRARVFCGMAYASLGLKKFTDTKKYIKAARQIYEKKGIDPIVAADGFDDFSRMYEKMNDLETSISFLRRVLEVPKLSKMLLRDACSRLFLLYSRAGKEEDGISYMEEAVEKLKESFGLGHFEVGRGYEKLGQWYVILGEDELALKVMEKAKEIFEASCGPDHKASIYTSHNLALIYARLQRFELAIETEEDVVAHCKGLGPSGEELMSEAARLLNDLKELGIDFH